MLTEPVVPAVSTDATCKVSPSGSLSLARTAMSIAVCLSVDALSSFATGGELRLTVMLRDSVLLRLFAVWPSFTWKVTVRVPVVGVAPLGSANVTERRAAW
jgi:hypothetical protein